MYAAGEEVMTLSHSALDRGMFARGALAAARWIAGRAPGEYDMQDVLGLSHKSWNAHHFRSGPDSGPRRVAQV